MPSPIALGKRGGHPGSLPVKTPPHQLPSQHLALQKRQITRQEAVEEEEEESDSDDDSFTSSSEEGESSETEESSEEDEDSMVQATRVEAPRHVSIPMRPLMAMNKGFGARKAKQAMMRMKVQRYPRILRQPIIKLDTIEEVRDEIVHQMVSHAVAYQSALSTSAK